MSLVYFNFRTYVYHYEILTTFDGRIVRISTLYMYQVKQNITIVHAVVHVVALGIFILSSVHVICKVTYVLLFWCFFLTFNKNNFYMYFKNTFCNILFLRAFHTCTLYNNWETCLAGIFSYCKPTYFRGYLFRV